jgi:hypothetical protein
MSDAITTMAVFPSWSRPPTLIIAAPALVVLLGLRLHVPTSYIYVSIGSPCRRRFLASFGRIVRVRADNHMRLISVFWSRYTNSLYNVHLSRSCTATVRCIQKGTTLGGYWRQILVMCNRAESTVARVGRISRRRSSRYLDHASVDWHAQSTTNTFQV